MKNLRILIIIVPFVISVILAYRSMNRRLAQEPLKKNYNRIISTAPSITEVFYAIGAQDKLAGVTEYCKYPPEAAEKANIGNLFNINTEKLESLAPDLILVYQNHPAIEKFCTYKNIPCIKLNMGSIREILDDIQKIGKLTGKEKAAEKLSERILNGLSQYSIKSTPKKKKIRVFISLGRQKGSFSNIVSFGGGTYLNELLGILGLENIMGNSKTAYPTVSMETIVKKDPQLIIELQAFKSLDINEIRALKKEWIEKYPMIFASRKKNVFIITNPVIEIPGPRILESARILYNIVEQCIE